MGREILGGPDAGKQIVRPLTGLPQTINRNSSVMTTLLRGLGHGVVRSDAGGVK
jgi:hypothetical protein